MAIFWGQKIRTPFHRNSNSLELRQPGIEFHEIATFRPVVKKSMARPASDHPTDGELEILRVLWVKGSSSLSDICTALRVHRAVATTTVATMLRLMHEKELVARTQVGRGNLWSAAVSREKTAGSMVGKLVDRVFDGSARRLVAHLVDTGEISDDDLAELQELVRSQKSKPRKRSQKK